MNEDVKDIVKETFEAKIIPFLSKKEPEIKAIIEAKAGSAVKSIASNETLCTSVFGSIHDLLPLPLKLVVNKDIFVKYCLDDKEKVLKLLNIN